MTAKALRGNGAPVHAAPVRNNAASQACCLVRADGAVLPYTAHYAAREGFSAVAALPDAHLAAIRQAQAREAAAQAALLEQQRKLEAAAESEAAPAERGAGMAAPRARSRAEKK
jgi:hypothetical protein